MGGANRLAGAAQSGFCCLDGGRRRRCGLGLGLGVIVLSCRVSLPPSRFTHTLSFFCLSLSVFLQGEYVEYKWGCDWCHRQGKSIGSFIREFFPLLLLPSFLLPSVGFFFFREEAVVVAAAVTAYSATDGGRGGVGEGEGEVR